MRLWVTLVGVAMISCVVHAEEADKAFIYVIRQVNGKWTLLGIGG